MEPKPPIAGSAPAQRVSAIRIAAALVGVGLLLVLLAGALGASRLVAPAASTTPGALFDPRLAAATRSYAALSREAGRILSGRHHSAAAKSQLLLELVARRGMHGTATHDLFSNYILYALGHLAHPAFLAIYSPDLMLRYRDEFSCSQMSYIFLHLALDNGLVARHVGLVGHVVAEVWYDDDWHMYDPYYGVAPTDRSGEVLSVEELAKRHDLIARYYGPGPSLAKMAPILESTQNNTYMSYPPGAYFEWKTNVLLWFEKACEILKWLIPLLLIAQFTPVLWRARWKKPK